jgi:hypothetical protein
MRFVYGIRLRCVKFRKLNLVSSRVQPVRDAKRLHYVSSDIEKYCLP